MKIKIKIHPKTKRKSSIKHTRHKYRIRFTLHPKERKMNLQNEQKSHTDIKIYQCSNCNQIVTIENEHHDDFIIPCPQCGHTGIIIKKDKKNLLDTSKKQRVYTPLPNWTEQPNLRARFIGTIFFILALLFMIDPTMSNIKISITLFFISGILFALISEKTSDKPKKMDSARRLLQKIRLIPSEKITLLIITATLFLYLITISADIQIYLVLLYLCLLIIKELIDEFTPAIVKKRLNVFVMVFFFIFIMIIAERIITIIGI